MSHTLDIYLDTHLIAHLVIHEDQWLWEYTNDWKANGFALSPHLPLTESIRSIQVQRFLRNFLPEGHPLEEITSFYRISKTNTFALIGLLGLDMPGALVALPKGKKLPVQGKFRALPSKELVERLRDREHSSLMIWDNKPRLSIAGIQDKINVLFNEKGHLGFGEGALCSTHLLKFEKQNLSHLVLNEYFSMQLAHQCGLDVAKTQLVYFEDFPTLLVERFDRVLMSKSEIKRYPMIDGCQALNLAPEYKYERNLGSGRDVAHIREGVSLPKLFAFADQCSNPALTKKKILEWSLFNLLIYNFDAHGKNISFFVSKQGITLTPFYDLVNIKMYPSFHHEMSMALGDEFDSDTVHAYQLADFSDSCHLSRRLVAKQLEELIMKCQKALDLDLKPFVKNQAEMKFLQRYVKSVRARCDHLLEELDFIAKIVL